MITSTALEARILGIVAPSLVAMGYRVVQLRLMESKRRKTLQFLVERRDDVPMAVDDCECISHTVSALLDVEDPIHSAYHLEISSPGLERPLTALEDFTRFAGHEAQIETVFPIEGRRRFRAMLRGVEKENVLLESDAKQWPLAFSQIKQAKLVATDALFRRLFTEHDSQQKAKKQAGKPGKKDHKKQKEAL